MKKTTSDRRCFHRWLSKSVDAVVAGPPSKWVVSPELFLSPSTEEGFGGKRKAPGENHSKISQ
uniref:Uncharacterized protein n=1 Tax=Nelumbo nucifera TaxID=4432 RepID=A0A822YXG2_NELNU|nr:TPA_asm: hypothetical protein HUJ06_012779 [Nelumbo nucifera]